MNRIVFCLMFLVTLNIHSQTNWEQKLQVYNFHNPVDFPMYLSGNFCELRSNHFHGGLDIKTGGVEGKQIFSIQEGYVTRIKISPYGYGKALYINHPKSGLTSVYAHLKEFSPKIKAYIQKIQKQQKRNKIDINLKSTDIPIAFGEKIAKSGNSGGSQAPHLHFEVRKASNQHPINPQYIFKSIKDNNPPDVYGLMVYDLSEEHQSLVQKRKIYPLINQGNGKYCTDTTIEVTPNVGFGLKIYDRATGAKNKNGFYTLDFYVDNALSFAVKMDEYSYTETRYVNALVDYTFFKEKKQRFVKLFKDPNTKLSILKKYIGDELTKYKDNKKHQAKAIIKDIKGNISVVEWQFKATKPNRKIDYGSAFLVKINEPKKITHKTAEITFAKKSLHTNNYFSIDTATTKDGLTYSFKPPFVPIHKKVHIRLPIPDNLIARSHQVCIVRINGKSKSYNKPTIDKFHASINTKYLGNFYIDFDEDAPYARFLNFKEGQSLKNKKSISIKVLDLQSGIKKYSATIDGKWVILDYDAKRNKMYHYFETKPNGKKHIIELRVEDSCGNKKIIKQTFIR